MQDGGRDPEDTEMVFHILKFLYLLRVVDKFPALNAFYTSVFAYLLSYKMNS
jgi:hypothetical protein